MARRLGAGADLGFQFGDRALQLFQLLAGAHQHRALHVEFLTRDQIELGQPRLQDGLEVLLQFLAALADTRGNQAAEAAGKLVDLARGRSWAVLRQWFQLGGADVMPP